MTIAEYLRKNPDLKYTYKKENKEPRLREAVKIYFKMSGKDAREKEITALCRRLKLPYTLQPEKGGIYFIYITPHIYD